MPSQTLASLPHEKFFSKPIVHGFDDVTAPDGIDVPRWVCDDPQRRTVMSEIITVGLDLAKNVFQVHGADGAGRAVLRKKLR